MNYFKQIIDELRLDPLKKQIISDYESIYGEIGDVFESTYFYLNYVSKFYVDLKYITLPPKHSPPNFPYKFFVQLLAASFSVEIDFERENETIELIVKVNSGDNSIVKKIHEIWSFQIIRTYQILIEEQMSMALIKNNDKKERDSILMAERFKLEYHEMNIINKLEFLQNSIDMEKELNLK